MKNVSVVGWRMLLAMAILVSSVVVAQAAEEESGAIDLRIGAFEKPTFSVAGGEYRPLKKDSDYDPAFLRLVSSNSEANEKLKHAETYSGVTMLGGVVILAGTIVLLQDTLDQKDQLDNNQLPQEDNSKTGQALGLVIVGGVIALVGSSAYRGDIQEAVEIYNRGLKSGGVDPGALRKPVIKPKFMLGMTSPQSHQSSMLTANLSWKF